MPLFVSSCAYEISRLLSLLVLPCIASKMKGIFLEMLVFPLQLCCIKCSNRLTGILVLAYKIARLLYDSLICALVFDCT